jgi:hypothetical protein
MLVDCGLLRETKNGTRKELCISDERILDVIKLVKDIASTGE